MRLILLFFIVFLTSVLCERVRNWRSDYNSRGVANGRLDYYGDKDYYAKKNYKVNIDSYGNNEYYAKKDYYGNVDSYDNKDYNTNRDHYGYNDYYAKKDNYGNNDYYAKKDNYKDYYGKNVYVKDNTRDSWYNRGKDYNPRTKEEGKVSGLLELIRSVTEQVKRQQMREGDPTVDPEPIVEIHPTEGKHVEFSLSGPVADTFAKHALDVAKKSKRQGELTLASLPDEIVVPGQGPHIELTIEGTLADKLKSMTPSQLALPEAVKQHLQEKLLQMSTGK